MPQVTVYIRKEDIERWRKIEKKSDFIHNALNPISLKEGPKVIKTPQDAQKALEQVKKSITYTKPFPTA